MPKWPTSDPFRESRAQTRRLSKNLKSVSGARSDGDLYSVYVSPVLAAQSFEESKERIRRKFLRPGAALDAELVVRGFEG